MRLNNRGFTLVEGLLTVIAISLIVGVGYYVYDANKKSEPSPQQSTSSNSQKTETPKTNYLTVKELSIKIPLSEDLNELKYEGNGGIQGLYSIYDPLLAQEYSKKCPSEPPFNVSLYMISKGDGIYNPDLTSQGTARKAPSSLLKQFDGSFVEETQTFAQSQGEECAPGFNKLQNSLKEAFKNAEKI